MRSILYELARHGDRDRGYLTALEGATVSPGSLPWDIRRVFFIWGAPPQTTRGGHAHREVNQLFFCVAGSAILTKSAQ